MEYEVSERAATVANGLQWTDTIREPFEKEAWAVRLRTNRGDLQALYYPVPTNAATIHGGLVWLGDGSGRHAEPTELLVTEVCRRSQRQGIAGLRLRYRAADSRGECIADALLGVEFLVREGLQRVCLVGIRAGGELAIEAASHHKAVKAVAAVLPQSLSTAAVERTARLPLLILHDEHSTTHSPGEQTLARRRREDSREVKTLRRGEPASASKPEALIETLLKWLGKHFQG